VHQQAAEVLGLLSRVQAVFGDEQEPVAPPEPKAEPHLEDNLGRGYF
jgi:hypothetical protein